MNRAEVLDKIKKVGVVAVIRAGDPSEAGKLIDAVIKGGIGAVEITMTVPGAVDVIKEMTAKYAGNNNIQIGAGTVLDSETARTCILAGANFIVSPALNTDMIKLCNRYAIAVIPGIMTVTEAITALEYGCDVIKLFPSNVYNPSVIRSFKGPLPQANFMPTGGINAENAGEWIKAGAVAVGSGSDLTNCGGDYDIVAKNAARLVEAVAKARSK